MKLKEVLNKFVNDDFLVTVDGLWDELHFSEYEDEKRKAYWKDYKDRNVKSMCMLTTNFMPELVIHLEE